MHDVIAFLKRACPKQGFYHFADGEVFTRNEQILAVTPSPSLVVDGVSVPSDELEAALARMRDAPDLAVDGDTLSMRAGRVRAQVKIVRDEPPARPAFDGEWSPCPPSLREALRTALPFVSDQPGWSSGIRLSPGKVLAICNGAAVEVEMPDFDVGTALISAETAEFLVGQASSPDECAAVEGALLFRWADGSWARCQLLAYEMPAMVDQIIDGAGTEAPIVIDDEFREAYEDAAALSDGWVVVRPEGFGVEKGAGASTVEIVLDLPVGHESRWSTRYMVAVVKVAEAWNPAAFPRPARFQAPGLRGIVMGTRR